MNVYIRPLTIEDASISYLWRNNHKIWELTGSKPNCEVTIEMEMEWMRNVLKRDNERRFAIVCDGKYVGNTYLTSIDDNLKEAELHYFIGNVDLWGKGVTTIAIQKVIEYSRLELKLKKIYANVNIENKGSLRMLEKNGFLITKQSDKNALLELSLQDNK